MKSGYTYYTQNAHGDVVNLTDSTGAVTKSYTCDAFGIEKNIDDAVKLEVSEFSECFKTEDQKYGMECFVNRVKDKEFKNK